MRSLLALVTFVLSTSAAAACTVVTTADASRLPTLLGASSQQFCFQPGTYRVTGKIEIGNGTSVTCTTRRTCIIDGRNRVSKGFQSAYGATQPGLIKGFVFRNFVTCLQVRARGTADDNEATACDNGLELTDGTARGNWLHHNRRYGLVGGPGSGLLIDNNDISYNNTARHDPLNDAGGTKIVGVTQGATVTWRNNRIYNNHGFGLWNDGNVRGLIEGNTVYGNLYGGIEHEISWDMVIRNNTVYGNNTVIKGLGKSCFHGAQINLTNSQNVEIYGNVVDASGANAICMTNTTRPLSSAYPQSLRNVRVYGNTVTMLGNDKTGYVGGPVPVNIVFSGNAYKVGDKNKAYWQRTSTLDVYRTLAWHDWQIAGQDAGGTIQ